MHDDHRKNNEITQKSISRFLNTIHHHSQHDKSHEISGIISNIFIDAGQKYLLQLIKLRRYWIDQEDQFLAQHAYPQNFSRIEEFTVTSQYLASLKQVSLLEPKLINILESLEKTTFQKKKIIKRLNYLLKRSLTPAEQEILFEYAVCHVKETVLHLIVYDGGFIQAIQFEMKKYLAQINQLLPEIHVDKIACHVGDLGQKRQDQIWVSKLTNRWHSLIGAKWNNSCLPAFIQRSNFQQASLMLYAPNETVKNKLLDHASAQNILNQIYATFPELQHVIQKIGVIVQAGMNPEKIKTTSYLLGESAYDPMSSYDRLKQTIQQYSSNESKPHPAEMSTPGSNVSESTSKHYQQDVQAIINRMKEKANPKPSS
ncbi:MAG: hypothetical protein HQM14_08650 [SAR324 cluster bacterium]|nr:hypothetical protein [SAR324 cluster bacterium]